MKMKILSTRLRKFLNLGYRTIARSISTRGNKGILTIKMDHYIHDDIKWVIDSLIDYST